MRRVVVLVGAVVFVDTTFFAAITPLLPRYEDDFELTKASAGILTAAYPLGTVLGSLPGGWLATRIGVRRTVLVGLALMGISSVAFGFAPDIATLDAARLMQGVAGAFMWSGGLAWLVAATPRERRGEVIGSAMATAIAAGLTGPLLGVAADQLSPELVFSSVALVAAVLAAVALGTPVPPSGDTEGIRALPSALRRGRIGGGLWIVVLIGLLLGAIEVLVPLRLDELGATGVVIGAAFIAAALAEAVVAPITGRLSDRRGRIVPLRIGLLAAGVLVVSLAAPQSAWILAPLLVVTAPAIGFLWAPSIAMISDGAEAAGLDQALGFALVNLGWGLGQAAGAAGGGSAARATTDLVPYAILTGLCFLTLVLLRRIASRQTTAAAPLAPSAAESR